MIDDLSFDLSSPLEEPHQASGEVFPNQCAAVRSQRPEIARSSASEGAVVGKHTIHLQLLEVDHQPCALFRRYPHQISFAIDCAFLPCACLSSQTSQSVSSAYLSTCMRMIRFRNRIHEATEVLSIILEFNVDEIRTECCIPVKTVAAPRLSLSWAGVSTCFVAFFGGIVIQEISNDCKDEVPIKRGRKSERRNVAWPLN
jgi:hypothetical protein